MRKIVSGKEHKKKHRRNQIIVGIILIFVMFGSVFGIIVNSFNSKNQKNDVDYNGYNFVAKDGYWYTQINNLNFVFKYHPNQTESYSGILNPIGKYLDSPLYIYSENNEAEAEIQRNLGQIAQRTQNACYNESKCYGNYPLKNCKDNFIIIEEGERGINQTENCVYIKGNESELVQISDEFLFKVLGIKN